MPTLSPPFFAVVTPYAGEPVEELRAAVESVVEQDGVSIVVSDGADGAEVLATGEGVQVIRFPRRTGNAGASPRSAGAAYAWGLGAEWMSFLDADCTLRLGALDHLRRQFESPGGPRPDVVVSQRMMCHEDTQEEMYVDVENSDGRKFADTNCMAFARSARDITLLWADFDGRAWEDRKMWGRIRTAPRLNVVLTSQVTVNYRTPYLIHYERPEARRLVAPKSAKILGNDGFFRWVDVVERGPKPGQWKLRPK